jgi:hypothetical protein
MAAPGPATDPQQVKIVLTKSDDENSIRVKPGKFHIHRNPKNGPVEVEWSCSVGFSVDFYGPAGSPFGDPNNPNAPARLNYPCPGGGSIRSGPATIVGDGFTYTVTIGGNVLDPDGQVDP